MADPAPLSNRIRASAGALLAAAGVGIGAGALIGYAIASRSHSADEAGAPRTTDEARRAIEEVVSAPASIENAEQLAHLLTQLGDEAIPALAPTLWRPSRTLDAPRALLLIRFWIDRDPKGAAEWAQGVSPLGYRMLALAPAVERIAESDPQQALRFVGAGRTVNNDLLKPLIHGWVRGGKPGVEDWIRNLGYGFKRQKALGAFARAKIARDGTAAAMAWFDALPQSEDGLGEEAFGRVTTELTWADPAAGVEWYERHRDGPYAKGLLTVVAGAWAGVDGPAALRWLSEQPAGRERDDAVLEAVRSWGIADGVMLERWGRELGPDRIPPWFQPGLEILAQRVGEEDPAEGIRWAERIANEERRHMALLLIARGWHRSDPAAAEAWLAQSPLTEGERALAVQGDGPRRPVQRPPAAQ